MTGKPIKPAAKGTSDDAAAEPSGAAEAAAPSRREPLELYLLRHAHAGDPAAWRGPDEDRPLSGRGRKQSQRLGAFLDDVGFSPDAILTSPKLRALETANIVGKSLKVKVKTNARLASGLSLAELERLLDAAPEARRVMLVGHDPDFSELLSLLAGCRLEMAKGALARIDIEGPPQPDGGELRWMVPPDLLKGD